ncbi:MAG: hypothetical protein RLY78_2725 [Pseudomonadota bacterium]|jgi:DNA-binding NtrC family response regulator
MATAPDADDPAAAWPQAERWPLACVLVVDDEPGMRHFLARALAPCVGQVLVAGSAEEAAPLVQRHRVDLTLLDITLPGRSGLDWLRALQAQGHNGEVVLITAYADLDTAIEALRAGACDLLLKPFRLTQVLNALRRGLERAALRRENWVLRRSLQQRTPPGDGLVGRSLAMQGLRTALQRVAGVPSTVLLSGESGTGKELAAHALHRLGPRADGPFVPLNCATATAAGIEAELFGCTAAAGTPRDGLFVYAQGGTLFLDEIAEMPLALQAALLRVLEDQQVRPLGGEQQVPVDVRIVAASQRALDAEVAAGRLREDLYWRLQVVQLRLPPLRAHKEDIPELVAHFIAVLAPQLGVPPIAVSDEELDFLAGYDWPGNVRELRNLIERSLIIGSLNVSALYEDLARRERAARQAPHGPDGPRDADGPGGPGHPSQLQAPAEPRPVDLQALQKQHIRQVLQSVGGDKTQAARLLGVSRRTLERRQAEWAGGGAADGDDAV